MYRRLFVTSLMLMALGCSSTLETGYEPRKLGASSNERRGYYASPFSPEARASELDRDPSMDMRRPRPGY